MSFSKLVTQIHVQFTWMCQIHWHNLDSYVCFWTCPTTSGTLAALPQHWLGEQPLVLYCKCMAVCLVLPLSLNYQGARLDAPLRMKASLLWALVAF